MNWMLLPVWSVRVIAVAALVLLVLAAVRALRERGHVKIDRQWAPIALRVALIVALLLIALNPVRVQSEEAAAKPALTVLLDTSGSMSTADAGANRTRLEAALASLNDATTRAALAEHFTLDERAFARRSDAADLASTKPDAATGDASDLGAALASAVADLADRADQAGVIVISDGRATSAGVDDAAQLALARGVPLWTWTIGGKVDRRDVWVEPDAAEVLAFSGADVELAATVHQVGYDDRAFTVELVGESDAVVGKHEVTPGPTGHAKVKLAVKAPASGEARYSVRVAPQADEAETQNNRRAVTLRAVGEKVRVLVAEGQPHWDTKFLVQSLKRDARVEVTAIYRLGKDRQFAVVSKGGKDERRTGDIFPRSVDDFAAYDVIVLGRGCEAFFDDETEAELTEHVARRGSSLVFARGRSYVGRFAPLAKFEPVVWGDGAETRVRLDPAGDEATGPIVELGSPQQLEAMLDRLPRFDQVTQTVGIKPLATVLARAGGPDAPVGDDESSVVMAYQLYGQGRVVTINAAGLWRWAFRAKGDEADEQVYDRFWLGLLRWLLSSGDFLAGHDAALRTDRRLYTDDQPVRMLVRSRGLDAETYRPRLVVATPEGETTIEPRAQSIGSYLAEVGPFPPGSYTIKLVNNVGSPAEIATTVEVVSGSIENRQLSADAELMNRLAASTDGRVIDGSDLAKMPQIVREWRARRQLAEQKVAMWDRWWILAGILVAMGVEWFMRRREGLL